ncbi:MAG: hypothetical protein WAU00_08065 [Caldilinea sp.]
MTSLIAQVRLLIGDPASGAPVFSDDQLQLFLDNQATSVLYERLTPEPTVQPGGATEYLTWRASGGWWEASEALTDSGYNVLTPATVNQQIGRWTFDEHQSAVLLRGTRYDVHLAAAEAVDAWMAIVAREFYFRADGADFKRSQQMKNLAELARSLRSKAGGGGVLTAQMLV